MKSKIIFFAKLKDIVGKTEVEFELQDGSKVADLKKEVLLKFPNLQDYVDIIIS